MFPPVRSVDARGLQEQAIGRVEQVREDFHRGQVAREVDVREGADDDERGGQQGQEHPRAEEEVALAGVLVRRLASRRSRRARRMGMVEGMGLF